MFLVSFSVKAKRVFLAVFCVLLMTAVSVVIMWLCNVRSGAGESDFPFSLETFGGIDGFLEAYSLEAEDTLSVREVTLPSENDENFRGYGDFLSDLGMDILKFSGKRVEERYLKLKNKTEKGQTLYAVMYIYKEKVIGVHLTTLEQDQNILPLDLLV